MTLQEKLYYDMDEKEVIQQLVPLLPNGLDYAFTSLLARAYNNNDQPQRGKELLLTVQAEGENDPMWQYRIGYSCFYLEEYAQALVYLERAKEMGCAAWADELLSRCRQCVAKQEPVEANQDLQSQLVAYLDCPCTLFNPMADDDEIIEAFENACKEGEAEGFVPMLVAANDETLLECLLMNVKEDNRGTFNLEDVRRYRKDMLTRPVEKGEEILATLLNDCKEDNEDDEFDWDEVIGEVTGGESLHRFHAIWDFETESTIPLLLAKIPVKNPWEVFAYLPFGNWNGCPDTPVLLAVAKHWYEKHGAVPVMLTHDELEFRLKTPVAKDDAMALALEQYGFCPDGVDQGTGTVGVLASSLSKSTMWSFWWD